MKKWKTGLVVGKFCPLHMGHEFMINTAMRNVDRLLIISYTSLDLGIDAVTRQRMIKTRFPSAKVYCPEGGFPIETAPEGLHREYCGMVAEDMGLIPDVVFTSEQYGDGFAEHLSKMFGKPVHHFSVDRYRENVPISGTMLRENRSLWANYVHPTVRKIYDSTKNSFHWCRKFW